MRIKKYHVKSIDEALSRIKKELGEDAYILSTKKLEKKGALNLQQQDWVEVTAAVEREQPLVNDTNISPLLLSKAYKESGMSDVKGDKFETVSKQMNPIAIENSLRFDPIQPLREEINELKWLFKKQTNNEDIYNNKASFTGIFEHFYQVLLQQGVNQRFAVRLIDGLIMKSEIGKNYDETTISKKLIEIISIFIGEAAPIVLSETSKIAILCGPTGVGKTTTIAKLAAYFKLLDDKKVALASMDGFRIGGLAQIQIYGDLLDVPVFSIRDNADMTGLLKRRQDFDLILIDTPGYSPYDIEALNSLAEKISFISQAGSEVHLLLDSTRKELDLSKIMHSYKCLNPLRLIFSKVDECCSLGTLFNARIQMNLPVSYLTTGQKVPEDIEVAHPRRLANRLMGTLKQHGGIQ